MFRKIREANRPFCTALVAAAGSSSRMGGTDKLMEFLDNVPVLMRTLTALQRAAAIDEIIIAAREDALVDISTLCMTYGITKCSKVVRGGESRCHSVLLAALEASPEARLLAVQDGARPLVTPALIDRTVEAAAKCGAAAPAVPVKDTIKRARDSLVEATLERSELFAVQTPQVFQVDLIRRSSAALPIFSKHSGGYKLCLHAGNFLKIPFCSEARRCFCPRALPRRNRAK